MVGRYRFTNFYLGNHGKSKPHEGLHEPNRGRYFGYPWISCFVAVEVLPFVRTVSAFCLTLTDLSIGGPIMIQPLKMQILDPLSSAEKSPCLRAGQMLMFGFRPTFIEFSSVYCILYIRLGSGKLI